MSCSWALILLLNLFIDAFEICSSLTPLFIRYFLYKHARVHHPSLQTSFQNYQFPCLFEFLSYAFAPRFWISVLAYTKGVHWALIEKKITLLLVLWIHGLSFFKSFQHGRAILSFPIGSVLNILFFLWAKYAPQMVFSLHEKIEAIKRRSLNFLLFDSPVYVFCTICSYFSFCFQWMRCLSFSLRLILQLCFGSHSLLLLVNSVYLSSFS